jgi:hypothetical protein
VFDFCHSLTNIIIPEGVTSIGQEAFSSSGLQNVKLPNSLTSIGGWAFDYTPLTSVVIPSNVTAIGISAFGYCGNLTGVYFQGDAPSVDQIPFWDNGSVIIYYLPGTKYWGTTFGDRPTALWLPQALTSDGSFGVRTNQFGFNIFWGDGRIVAVEACTNLANPVWTPVATNTITGSSSYFSDPHWTNQRGRFYRIRWP